ncbi:phosphoenolpyruvate synthase [Anaerosporomusa subterranea]|uniref:Phosphoenolpyruvate synthase n=1 Tax=Anaerosporomusa subterranea TaxID=1794912 RepID=A0A154BP25_ANASB|nr:PEP/pyruvate-binding domain-containing protein [Anaerosporomusa subterranea]KYZ75692.1 phosphoenolpyruvate synthase [Anaerosporomusa subterranea]
MEKFVDMKTRFSGVHDLMKFRVTEILLISTEYDAYVLEEDGQLAEQIYHQFNDLSIPFIPRIHWVANSEEAFEELKMRTIHLIITMSRISDMSSFEVETTIHEAYPTIPIVMLSYDRLTPEMIAKIRGISCINRVFHWSGDNKVLLAIIKYIEDQQNVEADSRLGVQAILLVDDSPVYYSQILPIIYTEILTQTRCLLLHAMNVSHGLLRVRLRPKILLAETYEEAMEIIRTYRYNLLGVISDVRFPKDGALNPSSGFELAQSVGEMITNFPFLLQSEELENAEKAKSLNLHFLNKNSPNLLHDLRTYILENYGFGSFVFKYPDGRVIAEASDITNLERIIRDLPDESLYYHASNYHFSRWFRARAEVEVADKLRFVDPKEFGSISDMRNYILKVLNDYFLKYQSGLILDFEGLSKKDMENAFIKLGTGSLGGKARGIAFMNSMIAKSRLADKYEDIKVKVPRSFVIGSDVFERFIEENNLYSFIACCPKEEEIAQKFTESFLPATAQVNLRLLTQYIKCPLAVRSSSILEDSRVLPFAGIYHTYVVPNSHEDPEVRFKQLSDAVKLVYASVFYAAPVQYAKNADIRIQEEKMAVLIQELVGERYGDLYYPAISGVAQSYNFYPYNPMKPEEGTVSLALGLGKAIVEGERVYRFSPAHPKLNPLISSPDEYLKKSQNAFYAVNLKASADITLRADEDYIYEKLPISQANKDQSLEYIGSTYSAENDCIFDTVYQPGPKLVTFAPILKYNRLPLTQIINDLLSLGMKSFGANVEIEFAVNIPKDKSKPKEFNFLQIRPMVIGREALQVNLDEPRESWCFSQRTIGNRFFQSIHDIIFVNPETFQLQDSVQIASEIGELNNLLFKEGRRCILIGFGRMGTSDRWLGIPLSWEQMSQALIIVEVDRKDLRPEPSLGSHFFHNLTATNMGYFHIQYDNEDQGKVDWDWLLNQPVLQQTKYVKLVRRDEAFEAKIDGRSFKGIIYK